MWLEIENVGPFFTSSPAILENGVIKPMCIELNHLTKLCEQSGVPLGLPTAGVCTGGQAHSLYSASSGFDFILLL